MDTNTEFCPCLSWGEAHATTTYLKFSRLSFHFAKCSYGPTTTTTTTTTTTPIDYISLKSGPKRTCFVHFYSVFQHFHFQMCFSPQGRAFFQHLNFKKCSRTLSFSTFSLPNVLFTTAGCNFSTSQLQKVLPDPQFFNIFTSKCACRHRRRHFFNICTYKSGPNTSCFVHFHFEMCFSPQRRAFFRHLNFKKFSEDCSFLTISLPNVLFATAACNF